MALAIATNNAALRAAASASSVNRGMETSMARLSSGKRINSASDDAAGVAISSRLTANIRGTDQAIRNALDGQALIDTAEGAHKEIENILQRMREVAIQAANDTNNAQDRANLQAEMDAMSAEIDRIAGTTTWAGTKMLDAESSEFNFHIGAGVSEKDQVKVSIGSMTSSALGLGGGTSSSGSSSGSDDFIAESAGMNDPEGISGMFWTFANDTFSVSGEWNAPYGGSGGFNVGENADNLFFHSSNCFFSYSGKRPCYTFL
jgi:flagellin